MKRRWRFSLLSILLALTLTFGNFAVVPAFAEETEQAAEDVKLTGLEITGLDKPVAGQALDPEATVTSDQGVTWDIPVIWTDRYGSAATVAEAGVTYFPTFSFYTPAGYSIEGVSETGVFSIRLPGFVTELFSQASFIFVADKSTGITYLTWSFEPVKTEVYQGTIPCAAEGSSDDNSADESENGNSSEAEPEQDPYWQALVHCGPNTLSHYGAENLAWLVERIKMEIQPRAIAALLEGFPAFQKAAENHELGTQLSLYVYDITYDTAKQDG